MPASTLPSPTAPNRTDRWRLRGGLGVVLALAAVKLLVHLAPLVPPLSPGGLGSRVGYGGYGFFTDELYFLASSEHLAWGFLDFPPLMPALLALSRALLGDSLLAVRLLPALAGAGLLVLTGWLTRRLGGGAWAQGLAALAVLVAPIRLGIDSFHSMNAYEPLFWTGCAAVLVVILQGGDRRWWLAFGALAGLGLLNKHSMAFFGAAVAAALVLTPEGRRELRRPGVWMGGALALALFLPHLLWLVANGFPHFEMLRAIEEAGRDVQLSPLEFFGHQILAHHPVALPLWLGGLVWLLVARDGRRYRILGLTFLGVMAEMLLLDGRPYYPAPAFPMLLAAGGVAFEGVTFRLTARRPSWHSVRRVAPAAYGGLLLVTGALLAPMAAPLLPPETYRSYSQALGITPPRIENHRMGPLPQHFADRFGWPEMAGEVARIYHALPAEDRAQAGLFAQNYGQAGALDLFGPDLGLPKALSGHQAYHDWGHRGFDGEVLIVLDDDRETLEELFDEVTYGGRVEHPYAMPYQHFEVWVCRGPRVSLQEIWPRLRRLG